MLAICEGSDALLDPVRLALDSAAVDEWTVVAAKLSSPDWERCVTGYGQEAGEGATLEWTFLPMLRHEHRRPRFLHQKLALDPGFFVGILTLVYRGEGEAQKKLAAVSGYWPVTTEVEALLDDEKKKEYHLGDIDAYFKTIHFWETVKNLDEWNELWNEFKGQ